MINTNEDALICDLAETYNIYDYKKLPATRVACFAAGLRETSRIKIQMSNQAVPLNTLLISSIVDRLSILIWMQTKDGQKGKNRPAMILDAFEPESKENNIMAFSSGEDFEKARKRIIGGEKIGN